MSDTYITKMYDRLDRICFAKYGDTLNRIVEIVIEANPGIEDHGILLPAGITVQLPDRPTVKNAATTASGTIKLW